MRFTVTGSVLHFSVPCISVVCCAFLGGWLCVSVDQYGILLL